MAQERRIAGPRVGCPTDYGVARIDERTRRYAYKRTVDKLRETGRRVSQSRLGSEAERLWHGYVGELIAARYLGARLADTFDFDLLLGDLRLDVKTVVGAFAPPCGADWYVTVNTHRESGEVHRQACDGYLFVRLREDLRLGWLLGAIDSDELFERGRYVRPGEWLVPQKIRFTKAAATVLPIRDLCTISSLLTSRHLNP